MKYDEEKKETRISKRYDVLVSIGITRENDFDHPGVKDVEAKPKRPRSKKSEAEVLLDNVRASAFDGKTSVVTAQVIKVVTTKGTGENSWIDEWAMIAAKRAATKYGKSLLSSFIERAYYEEHQADIPRSKVVFNDIKIAAVFKVCATADEKIAGFSVCSPSDDFQKHGGTSLAKNRYEKARTILENGAAGQKYEVAMAAELGVDKFGFIVGENDENRAISVKRAEKRKKNGK